MIYFSVTEKKNYFQIINKLEICGVFCQKWLKTRHISFFELLWNLHLLWFFSIQKQRVTVCRIIFYNKWPVISSKRAHLMQKNEMTLQMVRTHSLLSLPLSSALQLRECKMTAKIAGNNSIEMQSQCSLHWLNMPEQSLFTIKIHEAVTSGSAIDFFFFPIREGECMNSQTCLFCWGPWPSKVRRGKLNGVKSRELHLQINIIHLQKTNEGRHSTKKLGEKRFPSFVLNARRPCKD